MRGGALFKGKEGRGDFRKNSTKGGYIPNPYARDLGLGYRVRPPSSQEGDRGVETIYVMNIEEKKQILCVASRLQGSERQNT